MERVTVKRALLSVSDKTGLAELARGLAALGIELVSSGGTADTLDEEGIPVVRVESVTQAPEMMDGRVKTLHPAIHGGILADRAKPAHLADLEAHGITAIDLIVVNLYPFRSRPDIETIDIGGPAMIRAAAKNHAWVGVVTDPAQYSGVLDELRQHDGALDRATRVRLAVDAFAHTAAFDAAIVGWLQRDEELPRHLVLPLERTAERLRYGENPHQEAARYRTVGLPSWWTASPSTRGSRCRTSTSTTPRRRGSSSTTSGPIRPWRSSSTRTRAASPWPTISRLPTGAPSSATIVPRSAASSLSTVPSTLTLSSASSPVPRPTS